MKLAMRAYPFTMPVAHQEAATSGHSAGSVAGRGDTAALTPVEGCFACELHREALDTETVRRSWRRHMAEMHG